MRTEARGAPGFSEKFLMFREVAFPSMQYAVHLGMMGSGSDHLSPNTIRLRDSTEASLAQ